MKKIKIALINIPHVVLKPFDFQLNKLLRIVQSISIFPKLNIRNALY